MKKLFYIVLVIVVLLVIARLVKNEAPAVAEPEAVAVEETVAVPGDIAGEIDAVVAEPANPDALSDGEVVEEVEEVNPGETADEDETIINE
mgnify:CR=1 FL=1